MSGRRAGLGSRSRKQQQQKLVGKGVRAGPLALVPPKSLFFRTVASVRFSSMSGNPSGRQNSPEGDVPPPSSLIPAHSPTPQACNEHPAGCFPGTVYVLVEILLTVKCQPKGH